MAWAEKTAGEKDAVRIFKAVSQKNETCGALCAAFDKQQPEGNLEAVWIFETG
jgi:hypothetical protein